MQPFQGWLVACRHESRGALRDPGLCCGTALRFANTPHQYQAHGPLIGGDRRSTHRPRAGYGMVTSPVPEAISIVKVEVPEARVTRAMVAAG